MGYHVVDPAGLDPTPDYPSDRRSISDAVGLATLAAAVYELAPGEQLPRDYHYHEGREELFYVLAGTVSVRTPDGTYEVGVDSVFVAEPGSPHLAHVPEDATEPARVLGVGAPQYDPAIPYEPGEEGTNGTGVTPE